MSTHNRDISWRLPSLQKLCVLDRHILLLDHVNSTETLIRYHQRRQDERKLYSNGILTWILYRASSFSRAAYIKSSYLPFEIVALTAKTLSVCVKTLAASIILLFPLFRRNGLFLLCTEPDPYASSRSLNSKLTPLPFREVVTPVHPPDRHKETGTTPYTYPRAIGTPTPTVRAARKGETITERATPPVIARLRLCTLSA